MAGLLDQGTHEGNQGCWHLHTSVVVEQGPMWLFGSPNGKPCLLHQANWWLYMWINGNYWTKSGLYVGVTCLDIYIYDGLPDFSMLGCVFHKGMLGFQTASGKETVYFAKSNVCVGNVRPLFNWSWEINPHHPVCESGTAVKSPKKTSYLVKQRKLVMVSRHRMP